MKLLTRPVSVVLVMVIMVFLGGVVALSGKPVQAQSTRINPAACVCTASAVDAISVANCQCGGVQCIIASSNQGPSNVSKPPVLACLK